MRWQEIHEVSIVVYWFPCLNEAVLRIKYQVHVAMIPRKQAIESIVGVYISG
jgi:hypothetical protein